MREMRGAGNRVGLVVIGLIALLGGLVVLAIGIGQAAGLLAATGLGWPAPGPETPALGGVFPALQPTWVAAVVLVVGLVLALIGLAWLVRLFPRRRPASPFRLQESQGGVTVVDQDVVASAVEDECLELNGVTRAKALLRGSGSEPELTVRVTAYELTDLARLVGQIRGKIASDVATALDTPLTHLAIRVDLARDRSHQTTVVL